MKELKIKVGGNTQDWLEKLARLGPLVKDIEVEDIYFNTGSLDVLKISRKKEGDFLVQFRHESGNFVVQPSQRVEKFEQKLKELTQKYGIKKTLKRHQAVFNLDKGTIEINVIDGLGNFLVLVQDNPHIEWFDENLNIKDPEQITVPFSDL